MLPPPLFSPEVATMSYPGQPSRVDEYMDAADPRWAGIQSSPFLGVSHPYTSAGHSSVILTPISLAENPYLQARQSPALSHHSHEYPYHGGGVDEHAVQQGLGITSAYHDLVASTSSQPYGYQQHNNHHQQHHHHHHRNSMEFGGYGSEHGLDSPPLHQLKRPRRPTSGSTPPLRSSPVTILPHPDGLQRLEQERRHGYIVESQQREPPRPRPSGRGRRDPQAEEEDAFVESLRAQNLSWKIVAEMFRERFGKNSTEARLQMRMLRRRKSAAAWQEADITLLQEAHSYWQTQKYSIIASKLQELGASRKYSEQQIEAQLLQEPVPPDVGSDDECVVVTSPETDTKASSALVSTSNKRKRLPDDG